MKRISLIGLTVLAGLAVAAAQAAPSYDVLTGHWTGTVTTNTKEAKAGGNPTPGETGTSATIEFSKSADGLVGTNLVGTGPDVEKWQIRGSEFTMTDKDMTMTTKAIPYSEIPEWVRKQAGVTEKDTFFAFKLEKCVVQKTGKACETPKDLPDGIAKTGVWLFKVQGEKLSNNVYYTYSTGGKRILEMSLARKK